MKKLLLLACVSFMFIGCFSTPKVEYIGDAYYPDKGYFQTIEGLVSFRTINGTDKVVVRVKKSYRDITTVSRTDKVLLKFTDGKEISLSYNTRVSEYEGGSLFYLRATSGVIENFGTLEIIRYNTDDGYYNIEVDKKWAEMIIIEFNLIKAEATAKYGASE